MPKKIYIVRHGQTDHNAQKIIQGWTDVPLNQTGRSQAEKLASWLMGEEKIGVIYTSDLKRAFQTAQIISAKIGGPIIVSTLLRERNMGILSNVSVETAKKMYRKIFDKLKDSTDLTWKEHQGESRQEFRERAIQVIDLIKTERQENILIVTHGGLKRELLTAYGVNLSGNVTFENTAVSVLKKQADHTYEIVQLSITDHLQ